MQYLHQYNTLAIIYKKVLLIFIVNLLSQYQVR